MRALWISVLSVGLAGTAIAQPKGLPHREGEYGGVVPGQKPESRDGKDGREGKDKKPKKAPPKGTLTWIGFEAKDGGAQLFFQSVAPFELTQRVDGGAVIVSLSLTRLGQNTWRQVDTRFFDNPLSMIIAKPAKKKKGIDVRIAFKNPRDAKEGTVRTATEPDGMYYAYLSFPEGTPDAAATKAGAAPAAPEDVEQ